MKKFIMLVVCIVLLTGCNSKEKGLTKEFEEICNHSIKATEKYLDYDISKEELNEILSGLYDECEKQREIEESQDNTKDKYDKVAIQVDRNAICTYILTTSTKITNQSFHDKRDDSEIEENLDLLKKTCKK